MQPPCPPAPPLPGPIRAEIPLPPLPAPFCQNWESSIISVLAA